LVLCFFFFFFFSSRRRHTRSDRDWSSDVCSSDLRNPPSLSHCVERPPGPQGGPCRAVRPREASSRRHLSQLIVHRRDAGPPPYVRLRPGLGAAWHPPNEQR